MSAGTTTAGARRRRSSTVGSSVSFGESDIVTTGSSVAYSIGDLLIGDLLIGVAITRNTASASFGSGWTDELNVDLASNERLIVATRSVVSVGTYNSNFSIVGAGGTNGSVATIVSARGVSSVLASHLSGNLTPSISVPDGAAVLAVWGTAYAPGKNYASVPSPLSQLKVNNSGVGLTRQISGFEENLSNSTYSSKTVSGDVSTFNAATIIALSP